jgi:hypothetical protein
MEVVVYDRDTVPRKVDVQLDAIGTELDRSGEGRQGIFGILARRAAMANALDRPS